MSAIVALKSAALSVQVPFELLRAICTVESGLKPEAINQMDGNSPSHGLCQVKESTARFMGFRGSLKSLYTPYTNSVYAAKYLKYQLERYQGDWLKAISAYNRGRYSKSNTRYVRKVISTVLKEELNVTGHSNQKHPGCFGTYVKRF